MRSVVILTIGISVFNVGCGSESVSTSRYLSGSNIETPGAMAIYKTEPSILAFDRSEDNPDVIVPVQRILDLLAYDQIIEESLTSDKKYSNYLVTGIGLEAKYQTVIDGQTQNITLPIRMAIRARQWDPVTHTFSSGSQIFGVQGVSLDNAQEFAIIDPNSPNYVITGLGLNLREGKFTKMELKRTSLGDINKTSFENLTSANRIELPVGWAAIGLIIAVDKASPTIPVREPFVEDIRIYTGWVGAMPN